MFTILFATMLGAASGGTAADSPECRFDRAAMLALELDAFDQDMTGGWRKLANAGCYLEAADLLRDWREAHQADASILYWHEGQMRAFAGQDEVAIALFETTRKPAEQDLQFGWNHYVDGSIAFLKGDKPALEAARAQLALIPKPENWAPVGADGKALDVPWPPNLHVLDGFLRCWGQLYSAAYSCPRPAAP